MNRFIKILGLAIVLSFAVVSCGNKQEECKDGEKKECCSEKESESDSTNVEGEMQEEVHNH